MKINKLICICGEELNFECQEKAIKCKCGRLINSQSLYSSVLPKSRNIKLTSYVDTENHDKDIFGEIINEEHTIPVFCGYTMHREHGDGRWDDCDSWIEAVNISNPKDRLTHYCWTGVKEKILKNQEKH